MAGLGQKGGSAAVLAAFDKQIGWCNSLGSPFTAGLLGLLAADIAGGGPASGLVEAWPGDPVADALPLRLAGALHALVLSGQAADLAACYPPHGQGDAGRMRPALQSVLIDHDGFLQRFIVSPPQTNEVGRSGVLLGGILRIAAATHLPLRLLEIGASAGLNLIWDQYRYRFGDGSWGDPASPVLLAPNWDGKLPPLSTPVTDADRAGCDIAPIDLEQEEQRLRLRAYVWPDQPERLARLEAAIALAREVGVRVERADAGAWVAAQLAASTPGLTAVLYHSIMWQYMPEDTRAKIKASVEEAAGRSSDAAPLAWLRFEPSRADARPELHLSLWPGSHHHRLASAHPHGTALSWLA